MTTDETNIIPSVQESTRKAPPTLRQVGIVSIVDRFILDWSSHIGSYGQGGPGFVGFELQKNKTRPVEWLVLTLW